MIDLSSISPTAALAAGGVAAAVAAGWNHLKSAWGYVSSFAFVSADMNERLAGVVRLYLVRNCKRLPSGQHRYFAQNRRLNSTKRYSLVPWRTPRASSIYIYRGRPLFVSEGAMRIQYLRGTVNMDKLISDAIDAMESESRDTESDLSRFRVIRVLGRDKSTDGGWNDVRRRGSTGGGSELAEAQSDSGAPSSHIDDPITSHSFKYDVSEYTPKPDNDNALDGLFFDDHVLQHFDRAERWFHMGKWYAERGIPWRRGWLLYGPGGTGKSSIAKALASKLGIPVYQYYLATLSDNEFIERWADMTTPCIALLEDFDSVFNGRESTTEHKSLTFDTILNTISGVDSLDGVMLIVTTNRLEMIDPALGVSQGDDESGISTRPGRVDTVIRVGHMSYANKQRMAHRMLRDWPDLVESTVRTSGEVTPAQFTEVCLQAALERMAQEDAKVLPLVGHSQTKHHEQSQQCAEAERSAG